MPMNPLNWDFIETISEIARGGFQIDAYSQYKQDSKGSMWHHFENLSQLNLE